ncbi:hypothetical protein PSACC_02279 [Paramicrosporidium saccamoebae]|uniref:Uncharacterized protein n=1 Tax=Paramicrosporidium saccamoebae TaxID=1246581 RepID=A0A2H9TJN5_9FUNG|nr:hypothetical protein PSACC_02279 [Paramicrosporidium saccamoebae]
MLTVQAGTMLAVFGYFSIASALLMGQVLNNLGRMETRMFDLTEAMATVEDFQNFVPPGLALGKIDFALATVNELLWLPKDFFKSASDGQIQQLKCMFLMKSPNAAGVRELVEMEFLDRGLKEAPKRPIEHPVRDGSQEKRAKFPKSHLVPHKTKQNRENNGFQGKDTNPVSKRRMSPLEESTTNIPSPVQQTTTFLWPEVNVGGNFGSASASLGAYNPVGDVNRRYTTAHTAPSHYSPRKLGSRRPSLGEDMQFELEIPPFALIQSIMYIWRGDLSIDWRKSEKTDTDSAFQRRPNLESKTN